MFCTVLCVNFQHFLLVFAESGIISKIVQLYGENHKHSGFNDIYTQNMP